MSANRRFDKVAVYMCSRTCPAIIAVLCQLSYVAGRVVATTRQRKRPLRLNTGRSAMRVRSSHPPGQGCCHTKERTRSVSSIVHGRRFDRFAKWRAIKNVSGKTASIVAPTMYAANNIDFSKTTRDGS